MLDGVQQICLDLMRRLDPLLHVGRMQQCGLPGQELLHLLLWKTEKVQKDRNRERNGELLDEVAAPLVLEGAHKFPRPHAYCPVQRSSEEHKSELQSLMSSPYY